MPLVGSHKFSADLSKCGDLPVDIDPDDCTDCAVGAGGAVVLAVPAVAGIKESQSKRSPGSRKEITRHEDHLARLAAEHLVWRPPGFGPQFHWLPRRL